MSSTDPAALFSVTGLVTVITGGGTGTYTACLTTSNKTDRPVGIGLMLAQALESNGAIVYILGRRQDVLEKAAGTAVCFMERESPLRC